MSDVEPAHLCCPERRRKLGQLSRKVTESVRRTAWERTIDERSLPTEASLFESDVKEEYPSKAGKYELASTQEGENDVQQGTVQNSICNHASYERWPKQKANYNGA